MNDSKIFTWGHGRRYNDFPTYFKNKFGGRVQKISIDAGFTCPNRDGTKGFGGCTYCNNLSFQPEYCGQREPIAEQIVKGIDFFSKKYEAMKFLSYFQAFTNTYAPLEQLKAYYAEALQHPKIVGLVIATRPDCLDNELLDYLQSLAENFYVMLELGVESHKEETLRRINRGHTFDDSIKAIEAISKRGIHNCIHTILGLPGETKSDMIEQALVISGLPVENLKLHQLQIHKNTVMGFQYEKNPKDFSLFQHVEEYIDLVLEYLEHLSPAIIVERFVSSAPLNMVLAPKWGTKNFEFAAKLEKRLQELDTWQGRLWVK